jgi:hypothetical protein
MIPEKVLDVMAGISQLEAYLLLVVLCACIFSVSMWINKPK